MHDRPRPSRPRADRAGPPPGQERGGWTAWRVAQCVTALWLLLSPVALGSGATAVVLAKDVVAGAVLLGVTVVGALRRGTRTVEDTTCVVLGCVLVAGSFVLDHGRGGGPLTTQWSELVVGVLLICLGAAKVR
jgi:hypothetical protein